MFVEAFIVRMGSKIESNKEKNIIISIFLFIIFAIYPFYIENGYYGIDKAKNDFLCLTLLVFIPLILITCIVKWINIKKADKLMIRKHTTDIFMSFYILIILISTCLGIDKKIALFGYQGWYMGGMLIIALGIIYYCISNFYIATNNLIYTILISTALVFILGILNRFNIWPIEIMATNEYAFLSTLGNIGWYCGFMSVLAPIGLTLFVLKKNQSGLEHFLYGIYVFIVCMAGLTLEADGVFVFFVSCFALLAMLAIKGGETELKYFFEMLIIWTLTGQVIHLLRSFFPNRYRGAGGDSLCGLFNNSYITLWIMLVIIGIYYCCYRKKWLLSPVFKRFMTLVPFIVILVYLAWIVIALIKANPDWGNGRGAAMRIGMMIYGNQPITGKLIGLGPDCFGVYYLNSSDIFEFGLSIFGNNILTNAHNELLTNLVNIGLLGTIAFYGIIFTFIIRAYKYSNKDARLLLIIPCLLSYLTYNLIGYAQILNFPYLILLIAVGEGWIRSKDI